MTTIAFARFWYWWSVCFGGFSVAVLVLATAFGRVGSAVFAAACLAIHVPLAWYWRGEMRKRLAEDAPEAPKNEP